VFADVAPDAALAQEEIFGPVLAVIKVESFEEGLKVGQQHRVWADRIDLLDRPGEAEPGAAGVSCGQSLLQSQVHRRDGGAHPFGGFNMSGTDSKAGGPDYLYYLRRPRAWRRSCRGQREAALGRGKYDEPHPSKGEGLYA